MTLAVKHTRLKYNTYYCLGHGLDTVLFLMFFLLSLKKTQPIDDVSRLRVFLKWRIKLWKQEYFANFFCNFVQSYIGPNHIQLSLKCLILANECNSAWRRANLLEVKQNQMSWPAPIMSVHRQVAFIYLKITFSLRPIWCAFLILSIWKKK